MERQILPFLQEEQEKEREEAERRKREEAERQAKLDEIARKQREKEAEIEDKKRREREALLAGGPAPSKPEEAAPTAAERPSSGAFVPPSKRSGSNRHIFEPRVHCWNGSSTMLQGTLSMRA